MSDADETGEALVGVPGLPPLADLPRQDPPPSDEELWTAAAAELVAGPDLAGPLRAVVVLLVLADVLLVVLGLLIVLA